MEYILFLQLFHNWKSLEELQQEFVFNSSNADCQINNYSYNSVKYFPSCWTRYVSPITNLNLSMGESLSHMDHLTEVFKDIFNLLLLQSSILTCFKRLSIVLVPQKSMGACLPSDSLYIHCNESLYMVSMALINSCLRNELDVIQFA